MDSILQELLDLSASKWLGYRKYHLAKPEWNKHKKPVYEGSKMFVFTGAAWPKVRKLYLKSKGYSHFDLFLCRSLQPGYLYSPSTSVTSSCPRVSVCGGSDKGPIVRPKERAGSRPMKHKRK